MPASIATKALILCDAHDPILARRVPCFLRSWSLDLLAKQKELAANLLPWSSDFMS